MFEDIGGKIKGLAKILCWLGLLASVIFAIVLWAANSYRYPTIGLGFGVLIGGCLSSWIGSFFVYGFGVLVESSEQQASLLYRLNEEQQKTNELLLKGQQISVTTQNKP